MRNKVLILFLTFLTLSVYGQETVNLSLAEAQDYALQYNKTLLNAREDVLLSQVRLKEAIAQGLPQVSGSFNYMTYFNYEAEFRFGGSEGGSVLPDINYGLLDAGDLEVLNAISQIFGSAGSSTILMKDQANAAVQVSQLIFNGQYWIGIQSAKIAQKISEQNVTRTELDIKEVVISTYYLILISERSLELIDENIENLNEVLKHTQDMYQAGILESTDVDQIRINVSQLENTRKSMQRNLELSYNMLRLQLGIEPETTIELRDSFSSLLGRLDETSVLSQDFNIRNNPGYLIMESQAELNRKMLDLNRWAYAPTLTGFYSYTEKIKKPGFDISPNNAAGITVTLPIFSGGAKRSQLNQARIELEKTLRNKELLEDQLALQEKQLLFEYNNALENYFTQEENIDVAKRVYDNSYNKYKQGMLSSLDLTQANSNYLQAENNYVSSVMNLLQAKLAIEKLFNTL
ncbi:MAG: TolC family protein [Bacteroidales bacterium]|nr:TolC family protein [Bacteroidales bacterium]